MSTHSENNGNDDELPDSKRDEVSRLVAIIELCAVQAERSLKASQDAKQAADRACRLTVDMMKVVNRIADEQLRVRGGVPESWRDRIALVGAAAAVGASVAAIVVMSLAR